MKLPVPDYIRAIAPYVPGKPIEELEREYGIKNSIKLASNENPLGPSPAAMAAVRENLDRVHRYPDGAGHLLTAKIAEKNGIPTESVVIGNGSDDIIALLVRALVCPGDRIIVPEPSFLMYSITADAAGAVVDSVPLKEMAMDLDTMAARVTEKTRLVFICNPNNPTGTVVSQSAFDAFMDKIPGGVVVVVDEAYIEFVRDPDCLKTGMPEDLNRSLVTLRTFSKVYGLAGLRVGYGIMPASLAEILHRVRQPFNVNAIAQSAATAALDDDRFMADSVDLVHRGLDWLYPRIESLGLVCYPTQSNFFLIDVGRPADEVFRAMLGRGVIVRSMAAYGFANMIRINTGLQRENERFLAALEAVLKGG